MNIPKQPETVWRKWRVDHRITIRHLADYMGVSAASISAFERGKMASKNLEERYKALMQAVADYDARYGGTANADV